jgi:hypothetical protein
MAGCYCYRLKVREISRVAVLLHHYPVPSGIEQGQMNMANFYSFVPNGPGYLLRRHFALHIQSLQNYQNDIAIRFLTFGAVNLKNQFYSSILPAINISR